MFNQLLSDINDAGLEAKLDERKRANNFARHHGAFNGTTPYEALHEEL